jgi:hypothetical protein
MHVDSHYLDFGQVPVGDSSPYQWITIRNIGVLPMTDWAGGGVGSPFGSGQTCAPSLAPGNSCGFRYDFNPTQAGTFTDDATVSNNAGTFTVDVWGRGWQGFRAEYQQVTPRSLNFGPIGVGDSGEPLVANVTNDSQGEWITNFTGGEVDPPFGSSQNCAPSLGPGGTCQFTYTFNPTQAGIFTDTSNVSTSRDTFTIELQGEAIEMLSVTPLVLDFGYSEFGVSQAVTIVNTGDVAATDIAGGDVNAPFSASQNCGSKLNPGASCQWTYEYNPTENGRHTAISSISTSAGTFSIKLIGGVLAPTIEQVIQPEMIPPGGTSTISYTIHNPNAGASLYLVGFDNTFPQGMRVDNPPLDSTSSECGSPVFDPKSNDTSITVSGATIMPGKDCVVTLNVSADDHGQYTNTTDQVHCQYSSLGNTASATLTVGWWVYLPLLLR